MTLTIRAVNATIKTITRIICRIDDAELSRVPAHGPMIFVINHINFLEAPILYTHMQPRPLTGFAKAETWDIPFLRFLANQWDAIPLQRGEADTIAFRRGLAALKEGKILGVAPEGTRSGDGVLQRGHSGIVLMALRSGAPLLPIVTYGGEHIWQNLKRLRRTDFSIRVGRPFYLDPRDVRVDRQVRQKMADEIMYQLAALLPEAYRGPYANPDAAGPEHLRFV
jgi:1-acyl-sn-glycerol-3-phosphate acyltransferase